MQIMFITKPALKDIDTFQSIPQSVPQFIQPNAIQFKCTSSKSYFIISAVLIVLAPKTIALGAVATGSMKA